MAGSLDRFSVMTNTTSGKNHVGEPRLGKTVRNACLGNNRCAFAKKTAKCGVVCIKE